MTGGIILAILASFAFGQAENGRTLQYQPTGKTGVDETRLRKIDDAVAVEIQAGHVPGAVVLVARNGNVVFRKAYGNAQTMLQKEPMTTDRMFDMASVTKPVATATSVMMLVEEGRLRLTDKVTEFIPEFTPFISEKGDTAAVPTIAHLLTHTSGLPPYTNAAALREKYGEPCSDRLIQTIASIKKQSAPGEKYVYSCLGFITLGEIVRRVTGQNIAQFSSERIFKPLGMQSTMYCPPADLLPRVVPTEVMNGKPLRGKVHDPLAQLLGGVSGNAGLFSTVDDLAIYCQMILNGGTYGKAHILSPLTVRLMTTVYPDFAFSERSLGWGVNVSHYSLMGDLLPKTAFGHTGFTGTSVVIDPSTQTFIIILTNRVHLPDGDAGPLRAKVANIVAGSLTE
ncbi:MAG: serine hydrolase domain-containing protein [Candidatus Neomarinimicrobiota bacterium]